MSPMNFQASFWRLRLSKYPSRRALASFSTLRALSHQNKVDLDLIFPASLVESFVEDGACVVRRAFDSTVVDSLRAATERNLACPGPLCDEHADAQGRTGRFHDDQFLWTRHREAADFIFESRCGALAARAMGSSRAHIFYDHLLVKEPGTASPTPWHNDYSYWHIQGNQIVSVWLALDHVRKENCVSYVRGSHRWKLMHRITSFGGETIDDGRYSEANKHQTELPDIESGVANGTYDLLAWKMEPGDVLVHHGFTVHGATGNSSQDRRRGYATRWCGDDLRFDPRPGTMYHNWVKAGLDCGLTYESPTMECALHPDVLAPDESVNTSLAAK